MRILLVHPDDTPDREPWSAEKWDRIVDLGLGGSQTYERWTHQFQCPAAPLTSVTTQELRSMRELLAAGLGRLLDDGGLDWWELTALSLHQHLELLIQLRHLAAEIDATDEVWLTRQSLHSKALGRLLSGRLRCFSSRPLAGMKGPTHYWKVFSRFPLAQLGELFWDKYDSGHAIRSRFARMPEPSKEPVVLLPSAYVNVSRTALAYANVLPKTNFLLVTTRSSGMVKGAPANVRVETLSSYASPDPATVSECRALLANWPSLQRQLEQIPEMSILNSLGCFDSLPKLIQQGLAIRNAWQNVLETQPVKAVLCCDDSNPHTLIPFLLARKRGLPTLASHHGAFDGRHLFKRSHADVILAKGRMEEDYLVRHCGVSSSAVEIGAPGELSQSAGISDAGRHSSIVFFSEAYGVAHGRAEEIYRDILPSLAAVARSTERQLVIKLHPFESRHERQQMVRRVLSRDQQRIVTLVSGPLTEDLLDKTWFGMTILSTVAMECALRGVPCFMARWLEHWPYGYIDQFARFGVGYVLSSRMEISQIPSILQSYSVPKDVAGDVWQPIAAARFEDLISSSHKFEAAMAV